MKDVHPFRQLIRRVHFREGMLRLFSAVRQALFWTLVAALTYLLLQKGLGILPDLPVWAWIALLISLPILLILPHLRPRSLETTAHHIDAQLGTKDLFLSSLKAESAPAGPETFLPVVIDTANQRSLTLLPSQISPLKWNRNWLFIALALFACYLAWQYLPQSDPFGLLQQKAVVQKKKDELKKLDEKILQKAEKIAQKKVEEIKKPLSAALEELKKTLAEARPPENPKDLKKLNDQQKDLGERWQKMNREKMADQLQNVANQQFGEQSDLAKTMREAIAKKDANALKKAVQEVQSKIATAQQATEKNTPDAANQQKAAREALRQLNEALSQTLGSKELSETLTNAQQQLSQQSQTGLNEDASQGAQKALNLSQDQIEQLIEAMKSQENLEKVLKALQDAKKLAQQNQLDGSQMPQQGNGSDAQTLEEYAKKYEEQLKQMGQSGSKPGEGQGQGEGEGLAFGEATGQNGQGGMGKNRGQGQGGKAPEDDSINTDFKSEKSPTMLQAGKNILEWSQKGQGEKEHNDVPLDQTFKTIREGVGEAMVKEQVPAAYHESIKKYFDNLK